MKMRLNKKCPRCETKVPVDILTCPNCQLKFDKFESATNKEAKQAIANGQKDQVLMRKGCPADVKRWKLLLMAIFLGFAGGHHYYVGRYKTGLAYSIFFVIGLTNAIVNVILKIQPTGDLWQVFSFLVLAWGAVIALWIIDVSKIVMNTFKVPVSRTK